MPGIAGHIPHQSVAGGGGLVGGTNNAHVRATRGVDSVKFWNFSVALARGGEARSIHPNNTSSGCTRSENAHKVSVENWMTLQVAPPPPPFGNVNHGLGQQHWAGGGGGLDSPDLKTRQTCEKFWVPQERCNYRSTLTTLRLGRPLHCTWTITLPCAWPNSFFWGPAPGRLHGALPPTASGAQPHGNCTGPSP